MQVERHHPHICVVVAAPLTLKAFMLGHLKALAGIAEVTAVANFTAEDEAFPWPEEFTRVAVPIARPIAPWADVLALFALARMFRQKRYDLVHSLTPKAGLLAMLAAWLAGVPLRLHMFTGQVWVTRSGPMRALLKSADRLIGRLATHVLTDSASQREFLSDQGIVAARKSAVLAQGSSCGVDTARFRPDAAARERIRRSHGIPLDAIVFLYLGRMSRDKGLLDLAHAFAEIGAQYPQAHLLLVGPDEDKMHASLTDAAADSAARLHLAGFTDRPQEYYAAADACCLPSYREGFPTSMLEAAATGAPAIGSRIYGITDAIVEGETGLLFEAGNAQQLAQCMRTLAGDAGLRARLGNAARERAVRDYSSAVVSAALLEYYVALLAHRADQGYS
jgi:glycosyltransferase involved in cell wall biosynthesis